MPRINIKLIVLIASLLTIGLYISVLNNGFSDIDDDWMLVNNEQVFSLNIENVSGYFKYSYNGQYSPVNTLYYGLVYYFFGLNSVAFHLSSVIIHLLNTILVYIFVTVLLSAAVRKGKVKILKNNEHIWSIAILTAFLFNINPMQIETVAWISASKILLYSFFFLIAIIFYIKYLTDLKKQYYIISIIAFCLSFGSKEQAVVLPLILVLIDWFLIKDFITRKLILEKVPFLFIALLFGYVSLIAQDSGFHEILENRYYPLWQRLILANYSLFEYIIKVLFPINLSRLYNFPMLKGEQIPLKYYFYPFLTVISFIYLSKWHKNKFRYIVFGVAFFILNLVLALHIIPMARKNIIADRYIYISSIGVFFIVAVLFFNLLENLKLKNKRIVTLISACYVAVIMAYTVWRVGNWN